MVEGAMKEGLYGRRGYTEGGVIRKEGL